MLAVRQVAWQSSSLVVSPKCPKTHTARQLGLKYLFQNATFTTLDSPQHKKPTQIQKKVFIKERKISRNKLGFIGAGKLAESIARGVVRSGILPPDRITTSHSSPIRRQAFESFGVHLLPHNDDVVEESDVIIFAVKPQVVKVVVLQLRPLLSRKKLLVSIAAGVKLKDLQDCAGHSRFIRVMPNTPSDVGVAASVLSLGGAATEQDGDLIAELFGSVGKIWKADEKLFDAITGLSGSGPAYIYIYLAIEALADGGVAAGLPRELALGLASQTEQHLWLLVLGSIQVS